MFHRHKWVEESRRYLPPPNGGHIKGSSESLVEAFFWGQTVITYVCECGRRDQDFLLGKVD